jgi:hypothetical protein
MSQPSKKVTSASRKHEKDNGESSPSTLQKVGLVIFTIFTVVSISANIWKAWHPEPSMSEKEKLIRQIHEMKRKADEMGLLKD